METTVFESLGVAAADLSDREHEILRKREDVELIVENEVRWLPPVRRGPSFSRADSRNSITRAYLQGMRDASEIALRFHDAAFNAIAPADVYRSMKFGRSDVTWGLKAMNVAASSLTGKGVKVAVLDTGFDLHHADFAGRVNDGKNAKSFVNNVNVQDVNGHGTHCAGTVGGPAISVGGIRYGVAPDGELLIGKVFDNGSRPRAFDDDIIKAIEWADEMGARIISLSLGSTRKAGEGVRNVYETIARRLRQRNDGGVLMFAAAGNGSRRPHYREPVDDPAASPSILAVGAIDESQAVADFSNAQLDDIGVLDFCAPGIDVYSSVNGGGFARFDGTSMATPHAAGLAALYLERDPGLSPDQLLTALLSRVKPLGDPADYGRGLVRL
ncbi:MAG: S8 family serine peptidase [Bryobacteraceae bacterium]|nr:S8 family serine peptidase [Bryobacteraceae bacterium]